MRWKSEVLRKLRASSLGPLPSRGRTRTSHTMHPLKKLFGYARHYRRDIRLATAYSVINKFFDILPEVLIGAAVDVVVRGDQSFLARNILVDFGITSTWHQLLVLGVFNVLIWGGESIFEYLYHLKWRGLAQDIQHDLRLDTYSHVQKLEMAYFETQRTGNLMSILNDDINQMERFLNGGANQIIQVACSSLMISAVFFSLQPTIAVIALLPVPAILLGAFWFQKRLAPRYAEVRAAAGDVSAKLNNNLLGLGGNDTLIGGSGNDTVSYAKAAKTALRVMNEAKYDLLEKIAQRVAEQLLTDYSQVEKVDVLLKKPQAPVKADFDYMAVMITRQRSDVHE